MNNTNHVFTGSGALLNYLRPGSCGPTPIIELPASLNPFFDDGVRIFVKLVSQMPLNNIKSIPAWNMLDSLPAEKRTPTKNLVEYSSGNTALSLAIMAQHFNIPTVHALIAPDVPEYKKRILQLVGTRLIITDGPASPGVHDAFGGIWNACTMGRKMGWHNFNQYTCLDNPTGSERYLATELWRQLGKNISVVAASIGTSGTITGLARYLKRKKSSICIVGTSVKTGSSIPGPRGEVAVKKLAFPWQDTVDQNIPVATKPAYKLALKMIRLGLFVGPSTGMQLAGIHAFLKSRKRANTLDELRNNDGTIHVVFLACDTMYPYVDDFFANLPERCFPPITRWSP